MDNAAPITRAEHEEFRRRIEAEEHRQNRRLEELEETVRQIQALTISVEKMVVSMQAMADEQRRQGERLDGLEAEPGKAWKSLRAGLIGAVAAAIGAALVAAVASML